MGLNTPSDRQTQLYIVRQSVNQSANHLVHHIDAVRYVGLLVSQSVDRSVSQLSIAFCAISQYTSQRGNHL